MDFLKNPEGTVDGNTVRGRRGKFRLESSNGAHKKSPWVVAAFDVYTKFNGI